MSKIKLSECTKEGQIFLCGGEMISLQYILRMIYRGNKLPLIELCKNDKALNDAISNVVLRIYNDHVYGVDKEEYVLNKLDTIPVEVDITKDNIRKIDEDGYEFEIIK